MPEVYEKYKEALEDLTSSLLIKVCADNKLGLLDYRNIEIYFDKNSPKINKYMWYAFVELDYVIGAMVMVDIKDIELPEALSFIADCRELFKIKIEELNKNG